MTFTGRDIGVKLGRSTILHGVDFSAQAGQLTAIVGPNGSGKSTLLRALCGEVARSGRVAINRRDVDHLKGWELAGMRAVLPQAATLAFPFTVIEVIRLGLTAGASAGRDRLPLRALDAVGLAGYGGRFYQELSGGEQQRVQLARVLTQVWEPVAHGAPRWLLLDEPVSSLDIGHQLMVMQLLRAYAARGGGVIAVMHDLNLTAMYADAVTMVHRGRIAATGAPAEVLTDATLSRAYGCTLRVNCAPQQGGTWLLPHAATL
ncbi:heme ABC transporter ATP-binding protein [Roseovarius spongiae]|uniref:Heme ABC transporter ATP-binding protein n=1 Tax=Roseovarius spongiae TaxID=2320272 RepID=A0A3A8ASW8_9RHOB|nr:heme ABC transporter ATP-binding protein [Roseovarius spongiae]RKF14594.1 heme ABC transporter ATP-binding protein [Roseovarius spongiae]